MFRMAPINDARIREILTTSPTIAVLGAHHEPEKAAFYVFIVYFTQYTSWHGVWSLYEQHSFLVPVPFLGM